MTDTKSSDDASKVEAESIKAPLGENTKNEVAKITGSLLQNPEVMAAFEQKLGSMVGCRSGYIDSLPKSVKRRLKALKRLQSDYHNTESEFYEELHALECKYETLQRPILEMRRAIVIATKEPTDSECEWSSDEEEEENKAKLAEIDETGKTEEKLQDEKEKTIFSEDTKGIPEFWLTIFKNVESLSFMVQEHDEPILKNLQDIRVKLTSDGKMGFILEFLFAPNDYFENTVLTKEYIMRCAPEEKDPLSYEGPQIVKCIGCKIDWKKGKDVTIKNVKHKQKGKGGQKKMVTKTVKCDSFFNFFSPPEAKEDDIEDEEDDEVQALLMQDFEVGQMLQQNVIPKAVLYYTGEALESGDEDDDDEDYEYGEEEGDDEDNDEDEDPEYKPKEDRGQPGECKQQ